MVTGKHTWSVISIIVSKTTRTIASSLTRGINKYGWLLSDLVPAEITTSFFLYTVLIILLTCQGFGIRSTLSLIVKRIIATIFSNIRYGYLDLTYLIIFYLHPSAKSSSGWLVSSSIFESLCSSEWWQAKEEIELIA